MKRVAPAAGVAILGLLAAAAVGVAPLVSGEAPSIRPGSVPPAGPVPKGIPLEPGDLPEEISLDYRQVLPPDAIRPIDDPEFVPAAEARIDGDDLVIGVEIRGVARAYPVGILNFREMVNDRIGPVPFLVTW